MHPINHTSKNILRLPVSLRAADGEMLYCIRYLNPEQRGLGRTEPTTSSVNYRLEQLDTEWISPGSAGSLFLWSAEDHTYLERTPPPHPDKREALDYLLTLWFHREHCWPGQFVSWPDAAIQLVYIILDHVAADRRQDLVLTEPIEDYILKDFTLGIQKVLAFALGQPFDPWVVPANLTPFDLFKQVIHRWAENRDRVAIPQETVLAQSLLRKLAGWLTSDNQLTSVTTVQKLSILDQLNFGFGFIRTQLDACVRVTYQKRLDYQNQVLELFLQRLRLLTPKVVELPPLTIEVQKDPQVPLIGWGGKVIKEEPQPDTVQEELVQNAEQPQAEPVQEPFRDPIETIPDINDHRLILKLWNDGLSANEIAAKIGIGQIASKTVNNLISKWRKKYPELKIRRRR